MAIQIAGRAHLREPGKNGAVDHQLKVIANHYSVIVTLLPAANFRQCVFGRFSATEKVDNDGCQNEPHRHGVGVCRGPHPGDLSDGIAIDPRTHIQRCSDPCLMEHGQKIEHAAAKSLG